METLALPGTSKEDRKEITDIAAIEERLASIDAGGDMVPRTFSSCQRASHAHCVNTDIPACI